jgi:predicted DNA-binding transcriptional regulator YafY
MKIDRLLSIVFYLLNCDLVSASELSKHYEVSIRTIQRDMDTLTFAGIPILSVQGPSGGYGIMKSYKLDRQIVNTNDLFFILTTLESLSASFKNKQMGLTLEKIKSLIRDTQAKEIEKQKDKLFIDFSAFRIGKNSDALFSILEKSIENNQLIKFEYTDTNYKKTERLVEPMTIVFKWFAWYLFAFCRLRNDYRIFRLSRMENTTLEQTFFVRREMNFKEFSQQHHSNKDRPFVDLTLKFHPSLKVHVEDYFKYGDVKIQKDGYVILQINFPEDEWLYSMILGYGDHIEVLKPSRIRKIIQEKINKILKKYE